MKILLNFKISKQGEFFERFKEEMGVEKDREFFETYSKSILLIPCVE
jgi:hypothetical protein